MLGNTRIAGALAALLAVALTAPAGAQTQTEDLGFSPNAPRICPTSAGGCDAPDYYAPGGTHFVHVEPRADRDYVNGEIFWLEWDSPGAGRADLSSPRAVATITARLGQNWEVLFCRRSGDPARVCDGAFPYVQRGDRANEALTLPLDVPGQNVRLGLEYIGSSGRPLVSTIALDAQIRWYGDREGAPPPEPPEQVSPPGGCAPPTGPGGGGTDEGTGDEGGDDVPGGSAAAARAAQCPAAPTGAAACTAQRERWLSALRSRRAMLKLAGRHTALAGRAKGATQRREKRAAAGYRRRASGWQRNARRALRALRACQGTT